MWNLRAGGTDTVRELFGEHSWIVDALYGEEYQVAVQTFNRSKPNKYRLIRIVNDLSKPRSVWKREVVCEFDTPEELVAIAKLILAGETN
jgi:hypothetical protein